MRQITETFFVYRIEELSEKARDAAYLDWLRRFEYADGYDNRRTLDAFCNAFNVSVTKWHYDSCTYGYQFNVRHDNHETELRGLRLYKHIVNNHWRKLFEPKEYWTRVPHGKTRTSRIQWTDGCTLTGYCADIDILRPIHEFLRKPDKRTTFYDLMSDCLDSFFRYCRDDMECQSDEDAFIRDCEVNVLEFREDGRIYK